MKFHRFSAVVVATGALALGVAACGDDGASTGAESTDTGASVSKDLSGSIRIDGSSTVEPVAQAAVELFAESAPDVDISVGGVGTGDGFEKFCRGELQISDASRPIEKDEFDKCKAKGIKPVEVQVGIDGLSVVVNKDLATRRICITTAQLKKLLDPKSTGRQLQGARRGLPRPGGLVLHAGHGVGHI